MTITFKRNNITLKILLKLLSPLFNKRDEILLVGDEAPYLADEYRLKFYPNFVIWVLL